MYRSALALGTANQLTNILRDVGEDASQRNRIYVPLDELAAFKIREDEVCLPGFPYMPKLYAVLAWAGSFTLPGLGALHAVCSSALGMQQHLPPRAAAFHGNALVQVLNGTLFAASTGRIDDRWRSFMQFQIERARQVRLCCTCFFVILLRRRSHECARLECILLASCV